MKNRMCLLAGTCILLSACGGGGGSGLVSTPTPSTPTPTPNTPPPAQFLTGPLQSQEFPAYGESVKVGPPSVSTASDTLPRVRYDAGTGRYEVMLPGADWLDVSEVSMIQTTMRNASDVDRRYGYSSLTRFGLNDGSLAGDIAFGVPTPVSAIPTTGSASFAGLIQGATDQVVDLGDWGFSNADITGTIDLAFNFGAGSLTGAIQPHVFATVDRALPTMAFATTVYATGSANFSGTFSTALAGANDFHGQFTGPAAQELIGDFRFPYVSPEDGHQYNAAGAFVAKR